MTFLVHRAARADLLVEGLADLLRAPLDDPFAQELVLVPAKGIERWLSQRLSHRLGHAPGRDDGVCAGVEFRSPRSLISEILGTREHDPWSPDALTWPLLRVIDAAAGEPWARVLSEHLGWGVDDEEEAELRRGRRHAVARRLAGILTSYAEQRPVLLDDWSAGRDTDGLGSPIIEDLAWQPELWRRLLAEVGDDGPNVRHRQVVSSLESGPVTTLPPRLSLFGHTRLSAVEASLLAALGTHHDVHLWLPHPSDAMWRGLVGAGRLGPRRDDTSASLVSHSLLAAMSRDIRESQAVLERVGAVDAGLLGAPPAAGPAYDASLLASVQADIEAARPPGREHRGDDSVQVHACHGPARQVEVLRETILGLLEDDPTLQPRDILVMCPDIEAYAPLLTAAFGLGDAVAGAHPGQRLRVQLADRSPQQTNPLLEVIAKVLDLADGRVEATRVLDLLASPPVSRRFGFSQDDHEQLAQWINDAGVRWAWDESGRSLFGLDNVVQNTWRFGLDRVLTGVVLSDDSRRYVDRALPLDDVSSTSIALAGRLAEAVERLQAITARLTGTHPVEHWLGTLREGLSGIAEVEPGDEWQFAQVLRELALLTEAASGASSIELRLSDVRSLLHRQLAGRPSRANFRTGTLTICTMTPMRSVPHRVVCLLGLDDGVFPRGRAVDGDNLLAREPMIGEFDLRSQDRQLFLDAVMSAGEHLVITYTGFNESTGAERPPSVPLREFIDALYATAPNFTHVRKHHSQAFHPSYLSGPKPFSFDTQAPRAALASLTERTAPAELIDLRLPPLGEPEISIDDLRDTLVNPVKAFLRQRLAIALPHETDEVSDAIPVEINALSEWQVGQRLLLETLAGRPVEDIRSREWRRGVLPPGQLGASAMARLAQSVGPLAHEFETTTQGVAARHVDIDVELPDGRRLVGTVTGVHGDRVVRVGYSKLGGKQRIEAFLDQALVAAMPGNTMTVARSIGRGGLTGEIAMVTNDPVPNPLEALDLLVNLRDRMMARAIPLLPKPSWVEMTMRGYDRDKELRKVWGREGKAPEMRLLFGRAVGVEDVSALVDEQGQPLLSTLARILWRPIMAVSR